MGQITDNLKEYFKTHTKEEVLKDWENTLEDDNSITVNKFLTESKKLNEQTTKADTSKANLTIPVVIKCSTCYFYERYDNPCVDCNSENNDFTKWKSNK